MGGCRCLADRALVCPSTGSSSTRSHLRSKSWKGLRREQVVDRGRLRRGAEAGQAEVVLDRRQQRVVVVAPGALVEQRIGGDHQRQDGVGAVLALVPRDE